MSELVKSIQENVVFFLEFMGVVAAIFIVAYVAEKLIARKQEVTERILSTRKIAIIGMFSAIAAVLMILEFPVPFAPFFYKLDFSELPALIGTFAFGPVAGVLIEFCKIVIKLFIKPTSTAFVGELANFVVGCSFLLPASIIYNLNKSKKTAIVACVIATLCMTVFGTAFNAIYLLPTFAKMFGMYEDNMAGLIEMGKKVNGAITGIVSFVCFAVAPLNLIKGGSVSLITLLIYKKLSPILKKTNQA